jgi:hypothetical protein
VFSIQRSWDIIHGTDTLRNLKSVIRGYNGATIMILNSKNGAENTAHLRTPSHPNDDLNYDKKITCRYLAIQVLQNSYLCFD